MTFAHYKYIISHSRHRTILQFSHNRVFIGISSFSRIEYNYVDQTEIHKNLTQEQL